jgi:hypothetical protein
MRRFLPSLVIGVVTFVIVLIAFLPARFVFDRAAAQTGFEAGLVQGTVWNNQIVRLRADRAVIQDIRSSLRPAGLFTGKARFDVEIQDRSLRGTGLVSLTPGTVSIDDTQLTIRLDMIPEIVQSGLARGQSARVTIDSVTLTHEGDCIEAAGKIVTPVLIATGERYGVDLPLLNGSLRCAGGDLALDLTGQNDIIGVSGLIRVNSQDMDWSLEAQTTNTNMIAALSFLGFEQNGSTFAARSDG